VRHRFVGPVDGQGVLDDAVFLRPRPQCHSAALDS
jgi:hypothetical protein